LFKIFKRSWGAPFAEGEVKEMKLNLVQHFVKITQNLCSFSFELKKSCVKRDIVRIIKEIYSRITSGAGRELADLNVKGALLMDTLRMVNAVFLDSAPDIESNHIM
jgi:hypothetical protein